MMTPKHGLYLSPFMAVILTVYATLSYALILARATEVLGQGASMVMALGAVLLVVLAFKARQIEIK